MVGLLQKAAFIPVAAAACLYCGGCGLVAWPWVDRFPDPVKKVRVVDAETGQPIPSAAVSYRVLPCHYDIPEAGLITEWPLVTEGPRGTSRSPDINDPPTLLRFVSVDSKGEISLPTSWRLEIDQFWWPLPMVYQGWVIHHGFEGVIIGKANGFKVKGFGFQPFAERSQQVDRSGTLILRLERQH